MTRDRPCFNIVVRVSLEAEGDRTRWPIAGSRTGEPVRKPDKNAWNWIYLEPGFLPARAASILLSWGEPRVVLHGCTVSKPSALAINKLVEKVRERERESTHDDVPTTCVRYACVSCRSNARLPPPTTLRFVTSWVILYVKQRKTWHRGDGDT